MSDSWNKKRGFTIVELLIVILIIGILIALLIPIMLGALQKSKQKGTMKDIVTIATGCADYVTDHGIAPDNPGGPISSGIQFMLDISPFYIKAVPINDQWGNPYQVYCQETGVEGSGFIGDADPDDIGDDDFLVASHGRDGPGGAVTFTYVAATPEAGMFVVDSMVKFNNDLVNWSGNWISVPKGAQSD